MKVFVCFFLFSAVSVHAEPTPTPVKVRAGRLTEFCAAGDLSCQNQILMKEIRTKNAEGSPHQVDLFVDTDCQQKSIALRLTGNSESDLKICEQMMPQMNPSQKMKSLRRIDPAGQRGQCTVIEEEAFATLCERL